MDWELFKCPEGALKSTFIISQYYTTLRAYTHGEEELIHHHRVFTGTGAIFIISRVFTVYTCVYTLTQPSSQYQGANQTSNVTTGTYSNGTQSTTIKYYGVDSDSR